MFEDSPATNCQNNTLNERHTILLVDYTTRLPLHSDQHDNSLTGVTSPTQYHSTAPNTAAYISSTSTLCSIPFPIAHTHTHDVRPVLALGYTVDHYALECLASPNVAAVCGSISFPSPSTTAAFRLGVPAHLPAHNAEPISYRSAPI